MNDCWDTYRYLETEPTARKFLSHKYTRYGIEHPERHAFHQSNRFLYTLKQARSYYQAANEADLLIKPLLLFYGCINLLKALLVSQDPFYPQNSKMLQHGVTSRKMKRSPYNLLEDEVRPQKEGLFSVLNAKYPFILSDRYTTHQLFSYLPELSYDFHRIVDQQYWHTLDLHEDQNEIALRFPDVSHGLLQYSTDTFLHLLNRLVPDDQSFSFFETNHPLPPGSQKVFYLDSRHKLFLNQHPLFFHDSNTLYFWNHSIEEQPLPPWASHYFLLYLLGMISRYDTAWWGELVLSHSYAEIFLVEQFLKLHEAHFPLHIWRYME